MNLKNSKRYLFFIMALIIIIGGVYAGLKEKPAASPAISVINNGLKHNGTFDLMESIGIQQFTEFVKAPDFELVSIKGEKHRLSQYRGKVVLLSFWATW